MSLESHDSNIDKLRSLAIFSVVCAHAGAINENASVTNIWASRLMGCIGTMGVPIFFIISGYLFYATNKSWKEFWTGRIKTIVLPWLFCETMLWLYVVLRKGGASVFNWIKFILGYNSTCYYLTLLMVFYLLFWKIKKLFGLVLVAACVSVFSIICVGWSIMPFAIYSNLLGTPYLNPFHFMVYFAVGIMLGKKQLWKKLFDFCYKFRIVFAVLWIANIAMHIINDWSSSYFSRSVLLDICLSTCVMMGICSWMEKNQWNWLDKVGLWSFSIYLLHQFVVGYVVYLTRSIDIGFITLCRPFVVIGIVMSALYVLDTLYKRYGKMLKWCVVLVGMRT